MDLLELTCRDFRCLEAVEFRPEPGLNLICGHNAQGKTSLLEALYFTATSKSPRTTNEHNLLRHGAESFHTSATVQRQDRTVTVEAHWSRGTKRFNVNGVAQTRLSDILGKVSVVLFTPEDIGLIKDAASGRRQFMDMELSQLSPNYLNALQEYRKSLRQRNELLRNGRDPEGLLDVWDAQLARHGQTLMASRAAFVAELAATAREAYGQIAREEALDVAYEPNIRNANDIAGVLHETQESDLRRGTTGRGPHRDDMDLIIGDESARTHGSQGQQKSAALALKLAMVSVIYRRTKEYPILMLDEVLAELDQHRARRLFEAIPEGVQCLVTTTDMRASEWEACTDAKMFQIEGGRLSLL